MKIHCTYDELVSVKELRSHPKNPNKHSENQIKRLAQILEYQGWRYPVKVSKVTGFVTSGHGRIEAAKLMGWDKVPVNFQEYESHEQEYADVVSDNSIAAWAELDLDSIKVDIKDFDDDFNVDLLGFRLFSLEDQPFDENQEWDGMPEFNHVDKTAHKTVHVHFQNDEDFIKFASILKIDVTEKTKTIWYPNIEKNKLVGIEYKSEQQ